MGMEGLGAIIHRCKEGTFSMWLLLLHLEVTLKSFLIYGVKNSKRNVDIRCTVSTLLIQVV